MDGKTRFTFTRKNPVISELTDFKSNTDSNETESLIKDY